MDKLGRVILGLAIGGLVGGFAGTVIARGPPFTLPKDETSPGLNEANQAFGTAVGLLIGEIAGGTIALATDKT